MTVTRRIVAAIAFGLSLAALNGCETTTSGGATGANRSQFMLVSSAQLEQMSAQSYAKLRSEASAKGVLNQDQAMLQRVRTIAGRLEAQTGAFRPDAPGWKWEVNTIASNQLNAFCMPGGRIMLYSGLITQLRDVEHDLLGAHVDERAERLRQFARPQRLRDARERRCAKTLLVDGDHDAG